MQSGGEKALNQGHFYRSSLIFYTQAILGLFRDNLIQARQYGYCFIAFLMGVGTILILAGSKTIEEGQQTLVK